jgi:hypothetical protein
VQTAGQRGRRSELDHQLVALLVEHEIGVRRARQELLELADPDATSA